MKRLTSIYVLSTIISLCIGVVLYKALIKTDMVRQDIRLEIELEADQPCEMQFFLEDHQQFKVEQMQALKIPEGIKNFKAEFVFPLVSEPGKLRIDPGLTRGKWIFKKITLKGLKNNFTFEGQEIIQKFSPVSDIKTYQLQAPHEVLIEANGADSKLISEFSLMEYLPQLVIKPGIYKFPLILSLCFSFFVFYILKSRLDKITFDSITIEYLFVSMFIIILFIPLIWMNLFPTDKIATDENRVLKSKPQFEISKITEYPKEYNAYFNDCFGFKKQFSTLNGWYKYTLFNSSSKPEMVAVGKDSWLFSTDPKTVGDYQNKKLFSEDELKFIQHKLEETNQFYEHRGIHYFVMVLPIKSSIYPEYLPSFMYKKQEKSKLLQLRDYMSKNSQFKLIDVTNELIKAKKTTQVYYKHDIHWNFEGAYIAYEKLMNEMSKYNSYLKPLPLSMYTKKLRYNHNADLSRQLALDDVLLNEEYYFDRKGKIPYRLVDEPIYSNTPISQPTVRTQISKSPYPKAVVYKDSYFNLIYPFFSENFSDCIYVWSKDQSLEVLEKETPGYIVYELTEADIDKLLEDNPEWMKTK